MDFSWTPEQLELRDSVLEFARKALDAGFEARERAGTFSRDLWRTCAEFGIHGLPIPEEYGGSGQDPLTTMLAMEALGLGCRDQGLLFSIHAQMWSIEMPILKFGTVEQRARYLPPLCDGSLIGAHGMTEPDTGSDAFALRTRAEKRGDRYVLNGSKMFVTNAPESELILAFATVAPQRGMWGVTAFLVDRETPGVSIGNPIAKMGLTTSPMGEVVFEDCEVPDSALLGREGQGSVVFNHSMAWERSCILASTVGAMEHQLDVCLTYAQERHQFGRAIGSFQLVAAKLAEMKLRLETSRLLLYRAAWTQASGADNALDGAMAKLYISEASVQSALDAIQVHGGYGFMKEFGVERDLRDNMGARLYSGTSEIQRLLIARHLGLRPE
jgi:alkylation response protein AidB-like acyl-CoA dehydrogenase